MANAYPEGTTVVLYRTFEVDEVATDPTVVWLDVRKPGGSTAQYQYGVGGQIVKDAVGAYHSDHIADTPGVWLYTWWSTDPAIADYTGEFVVVARRT